jgi:regulator of protease activity HflC (stomatin/prohibitin superfamily)
VERVIGGNPANHSLWNHPLGPGTYFIIPLIDKPTIYSTESRIYTMAAPDAISVQTRDKHQLSVAYSFIYHIDPNRADIVHIMWGDQYEERFIRPTMQQAVRDVFARYTEDELGRDFTSSAKSLQEQVRQVLSLEFYENGIILDNAILREVRFTNEFVATLTAESMATATASANKK